MCAGWTVGKTSDTPSCHPRGHHGGMRTRTTTPRAVTRGDITTACVGWEAGESGISDFQKQAIPRAVTQGDITVACAPGRRRLELSPAGTSRRRASAGRPGQAASRTSTQGSITARRLEGRESDKPRAQVSCIASGREGDAHTRSHADTVPGH